MAQREELNLRTSSGIAYSLLAGYPKISCKDILKTTAVEKYRMRTSDARAFYEESFPQPIIRGNYVDLPIRRRMPRTGFLITTTLDFEAFRDSLPWDPLNWDPENSQKYDEYCTVTINYETMLESDSNPRDPEKPETFLEREMDAGGDFLTINPSKTGVAEVDIGNEASGGNSTPNKDKSMPIVIVIPTVEWSMRWNHAIAPNWSSLFSLLGTVNQDQYKFLENAEKETVLFAGFSGSQTHYWTGKLTEDAEPSQISSWVFDLKFSQRRIQRGTKVYGWNHVWSPDKQKFVKPTIGDMQMYRTDDFLDMFTVDPTLRT